jgi:A/G-specific adenine glycosylase
MQRLRTGWLRREITAVLLQGDSTSPHAVRQLNAERKADTLVRRRVVPWADRSVRLTPCGCGRADDLSLFPNETSILVQSPNTTHEIGPAMQRNGLASSEAPVWLSDPARRRLFTQRLRTWFRRHARDLPWRRTRDPYAVWVSEIMLQQTQVATVVPYFERFMRRFPTLAALAEADEQDVLRLWEGLGYYRRARQLHRAARQVVDEHGGEFPRDPQAVRRLPGIGRYTAGAILSLAFDAREPILEANTLRLWSRLLAYRGDPRGAAGQRVLWAAAGQILPRRGVGAFNQALMELGAEICRPRRPVCESCPLAGFCNTRRLGLQQAIPAPTAKPKTESVREAAIVVRRGSRVLIVQRGDGARWAGMWDFPRFTLPDGLANGEATAARFLQRKLRAIAGVHARRIRRLTTLRHTVTRFRITLDGYEAEHVASSAGVSRSDLRWIEPARLADYPLSATGRKLAQLVAERGPASPAR